MNTEDLRFQNLNEVSECLSLLSEAGYERKGNWSLGQVCNHLAIMMEFSQRVRRYRAGALLQRTGVPIFLRLLFLGRIGRVFKLRVPAMPFAQQKRSIDDDAGVKRLTLAMEKQQCDVTAACVTCTRFQLWHCTHHLGFLTPLAEQSLSPQKPSVPSAAGQPV